VSATASQTTAIPILISRGYHALVDAEDYERVLAYCRNWTVHTSADGQVYAKAHVPGSGKRGKSIRLHRFLLDAKPGELVDHWDGDGLNNCRYNLRKCQIPAALKATAIQEGQDAAT
jgi:hypothetical protein